MFRRWGWLLLQTFHIYLSPREIRRVAEFVSNAAKTLRASNASDGHVDEVILAPFPMCSIPCVTVFKPQPLAPELRVKQSVTLFPSLMDSSTTEVHQYLQYMYTCMYMHLYMYK